MFHCVVCIVTFLYKPIWMLAQSIHWSNHSTSRPSRYFSLSSFVISLQLSFVLLLNRSEYSLYSMNPCSLQPKFKRSGFRIGDLSTVKQKKTCQFGNKCVQEFDWKQVRPFTASYYEKRHPRPIEVSRCSCSIPQNKFFLAQANRH